MRFRTRTELPLDVQRSVDVAVADLDGDGVTDIAAADLEGGVVIRLGVGGGIYQTVATLDVDGVPLAVVAEDLDADGALDLVVASAVANVATIFLNQGGASFAQAQQVDVQDLPTGMIIGDYSGDGVPDMVVTHLSRSDLLLFGGVGDGTFGSPISIALPRGTRTAGLTVADVNQDGSADILVCDTDNDRIIIRYGADPTGTAGVAVVAVGATPIGISLGDVDADGQVDIAVSAFDGNTIDFVTHRGDNQFELFRSIPAGGRPARSVIADIDGDGFPELAVCLLNRSAVSVFEGSANGVSSDGEQYPATGFPYRPLVADLAGDGRPDLALVSSNVQSMNVYETTDEGLRSSRTIECATERPLLVASADIDGDEESDIIVAGTESGTLAVLSPDRSPGAPELRQVYDIDVGAEFSNIAVADLDADGRPDLMLAVTGGVALLANESEPGAIAFRRVPAGPGSVIVPGEIAAGLQFVDVTGDGRGDLVAAFFGDNRVVVLPGTEQPFVFADPIATEVTGNPVGIAVGDFDVDGRAEVAVTRRDLSLITVFDVAASGELSVAFDIAVPAGPSYLETADFDGDARADLAVGSSFDDVVQILLTQPGGGYIVREVSIGGSATALLARDVDLDGAPDLIVTNLNGMSFDVILTDGSGGLRRQQTFPGVFGAASAVFADVSGSPLPDLVIGSSEIDRVTVFRNVSATADQL